MFPSPSGAVAFGLLGTPESASAAVRLMFPEDGASSRAAVLGFDGKLSNVPQSCTAIPIVTDVWELQDVDFSEFDNSVVVHEVFAALATDLVFLEGSGLSRLYGEVVCYCRSGREACSSGPFD